MPAKGSKSKSDNDPFPNGKPNQDLLQNLSFVYQANVYLASLGDVQQSASRLKQQSREQPQAGPSRAPKCPEVQSNRSKGQRSASGDANTGLGAVARRSNRGCKYAVQHSMLKT